MQGKRRQLTYDKYRWSCPKKEGSFVKVWRPPEAMYSIDQKLLLGLNKGTKNPLSCRYSDKAARFVEAIGPSAAQTLAL